MPNKAKPSAASHVLNVSQAAEFLQMSPQFVREHARELGGVSFGGSENRAGAWRFTKEKLEEVFNRSGRARRCA
jgi:hypothetical protein